jgi:hypothetical protein
VAGVQPPHIFQARRGLQDFGDAGEIAEADQALLAWPDVFKQVLEFRPKGLGLLVLPGGIEEKLAVLDLEAALAFRDASLAEQEVLAGPAPELRRLQPIP